MNPHTYIILRNHIPKILCILLTGGSYAPDATCIATPLLVRKMNAFERSMVTTDEERVTAGGEVEEPSKYTASVVNWL